MLFKIFFFCCLSVFVKMMPTSDVSEICMAVF